MTVEYKLDFCECLNRCMCEAHMSKSALSDISGISLPTISKYCSDHNKMPSLEYAYKIARALDVSIDSLIAPWNDISDEELFKLERLGVGAYGYSE